jgi:tetratricopeptide (TPR) repeat protein
VPAAPDASDTPDSPSVPASKQFPFPGEAPASPSGGSSSSSSSSNGDVPAFDPNAVPADPSKPALADKGSEGASPTPGRHILHRVNPIGTKLQSDDERETEDLNVAHFYISTGDVKGAYLRSQDAVKTSPDDPDAHFMLAETALKLNKKDEAIAEYTACLKLDPIEKEARDAHKALARLKP